MERGRGVVRRFTGVGPCANLSATIRSRHATRRIEAIEQGRITLLGKEKMKALPYVIGMIFSGIVLFVAYTDGGYHSHVTFYAAAMASSYAVYSSVALIVTRCGKKKRQKAWIFFGCGVALMFAFIPSLRYVIDLFYVERFRGMDSGDALPVIRELFYYGPVIVGSLCIFRSLSLWSDDSLEKEEPNH